MSSINAFNSLYEIPLKERRLNLLKKRLLSILSMRFGDAYVERIFNKKQSFNSLYEIRVGL